MTQIVSNRSPNRRVAKIHRTYAMDEVAAVFGFHPNTLRERAKRGLRTGVPAHYRHIEDDTKEQR